MAFIYSIPGLCSGKICSAAVKLRQLAPRQNNAVLDSLLHGARENGLPRARKERAITCRQLDDTADVRELHREMARERYVDGVKLVDTADRLANTLKMQCSNLSC